ncbi:hypothetical protein [Haloarchaeobius sp. TZWWS8]|uniref:hypothetical protein n=1 Tax=Haloarchaeobius sp. TZWWS8 TaxID=3446121 RepID=UPI003EBEC983
MTRCAFHTPTFDGTSTDDWEAPTRDDFETDDLGVIADHFLCSETGFPPIRFEDLALPVVDPDGNLNRHALEAITSADQESEPLAAMDDLVAVRVQSLAERLKASYFEDETRAARSDGEPSVRAGERTTQGRDSAF